MPASLYQENHKGILGAAAGKYLDCSANHTRITESTYSSLIISEYDLGLLNTPPPNKFCLNFEDTSDFKKCITVYNTS